MRRACAGLLDPAVFISHLLSNRLKPSQARSHSEEKRSHTCGEATRYAGALSQHFLSLPVLSHFALSFPVMFKHHLLMDVDVRDHRLSPLSASFKMLHRSHSSGESLCSKCSRLKASSTS